MFQLGLGGVVAGDGLLDGLRQRNIFPLPKITGCGGSGAQSSNGWEGLANAGIKALNDLSGCLIDFSQKKPTRAQRRILQHISDSYRDCVVSDSIDPGRSCLEDMCSSSRLYQVDRSDVVSYAKDLVSWPEASSHPVALEGCLCPADREWLATWREQMLRPEDAGNIEGIVKPYTDPILKHNQVEYAGFLQELHQRSMIRYRVHTSHDEHHPALGIFFVKKKNGKQRLIFDTRVLNQRFIDPPSTDLPSADSFTRLEIPEGETFFIGSGDLANAFYTLEVPDELGQLFTLPAIKAGLVGMDQLDTKLRRDTVLVPYLTVLPMGWAWALHFCQGVLMNAIQTCGFSVNNIISDKTNPVHLGSTEDVAVAGYVDNFAVIGCNPSVVNAGLTKIGNHLRALGLTVHEEAEAEVSADFVGLHFDGESGFVSIKPQRIIKLQRAIQELLARNFASGELLQLVLGHITWAMMSRREGLSILNSCYAFCHQHKCRASRLWPSVRRELEWIAALLPLFRAKINVGWSSDVFASDSSPFGYGVCQRQLPSDLVRGVGSQSERWRFRFEDAVDARAHAAKAGGVDKLDKSNLSHLISSSFQDIVDDLSGEGFHEVPPDILVQSDWNVVWSSPWKRHDNILRTEGLALVWAVEHSLRANRNLGKKLLFLCDNLPLALSASKGRAKSGYLVHVLRKVCALTLASGMAPNVQKDQKLKERRLARRYQVAAKTEVPQGLTYLETRSVREPTLKDYQRRLELFNKWLMIQQLRPIDATSMDECLVEYLQDLFDDGKGVNDGVRTLAAIRFFQPSMAMSLLRSSRALKGWHLASPPLQRMPLPIEVLTAIMGVMLIKGHVEEPLRLFLQFMTYLRPGECSNLLVKQVVAPQHSVHQVFNYWAILLNPSEDLIPGKTGVFDGSVIIDSDIWIGPFLTQLVRNRNPEAPLWRTDHATLRAMFNSAVESLGLQELGVTLYTLRHGGATHDILARRRTMLEIKQRGCLHLVAPDEKSILWLGSGEAKANDLEMVRRLLKMGADPMQKSSRGRTALQMVLSQDMARMKETGQRPDNSQQIKLLLSAQLSITPASWYR
eukprot:s336_g25.t1